MMGEREWDVKIMKERGEGCEDNGGEGMGCEDNEGEGRGNGR